jgi:hypothetical protein
MTITHQGVDILPQSRIRKLHRGGEKSTLTRRRLHDDCQIVVQFPTCKK